MSKKLIISGKERIIKPGISFIMSFFITGMGEIYSGSFMQGIILALFRAAVALAVPFYSIVNIKNSYLTEISLSIILFLIITVFSPINAYFTAIKIKKVVLSKLSSIEFLIMFAISCIITTGLALTVFFSFFSIIRVNNNHPPVIEKGDIAVVKKIVNRSYNNGEMVITNDKNFSYLRIIGQPGEKIAYSKSRFSIQGSELFQSIFTESELKQLSLTDYDVISEISGNYKYPVIQNKSKHDIDITLKNDEYYAAPDDRRELSQFIIIKKENIYGRVEGLLYTKNRNGFFIKPYRISD